MNKIEIFKNEEGKVVFKVKEEIYQLDYDSFEKLIDIVLSEDGDYEVDSDVEFEEYKKLLDGIIKGVNTEDFKNAVNAAEKSQNELKNNENSVVVGIGDKS